MPSLKEFIQKFDFLNREKMSSFLWIGSALFFLGLFMNLSWELHEDNGLDSLDRQILLLISNYRFSALNGPAVDLTALGSPIVLTLISIIGVTFLWLKNDRFGSAFLAVGSIGSGLGTFLMKHLFTRERPTIIPKLVEVSGFSYPSGHSLGATSIYLILMIIVWRYFYTWRSRGLLLIFTLLMINSVAFSRLYLGVHYPSDVLSGMLLGGSWVCGLMYFFSRKMSHDSNAI